MGWSAVLLLIIEASGTHKISSESTFNPMEGSPLHNTGIGSYIV